MRMCQVCGREYGLDKKGNIKRHSARSKRQIPEACKGSHQAPADAMPE